MSLSPSCLNNYQLFLFPQVVGNPDAFKDVNVCKFTNGHSSDTNGHNTITNGSDTNSHNSTANGSDTNGHNSITNGNDIIDANENGSDNVEANNSDNENGPFELSYYVQKNSETALPSDLIVDDIEAYKSSLTTYPVIHIIK